MPNFRTYDLHHTHITLVLLRKVPTKIFSNRAVHSSALLTVDTYSHVLPTMQRMAADELEATGQF